MNSIFSETALPNSNVRMIHVLKDILNFVIEIASSFLVSLGYGLQSDIDSYCLSLHGFQ